ncbi:MAG: 1-aminocyclopropane-1-carboxylate deaminase/D-cysteine desulfhydrase [Actinomycetota bacterium]
MRELPRLRLAVLPTPLVRAERAEAALDAPPIWVKRDDLTGFALAGNKARKLEFLMAEALDGGCDVVLTAGGPGSNHCQATAAAARVAGLSCKLIMYGDEPARAPTNLRLAHAFGAEVSFTGDPDRSSVDAAMQVVADELTARGLRPVTIPRGGATPLGAVGYAAAADELARQLADAGVVPSLVTVATGSSGTQAGLIAGSVGRSRHWRVVGASVSRPPDEAARRVLDLARGCAEILDLPAATPSDVEVRDARGPGYRTPSEPGIEAARLFARTEGLLLDGVFTAKAAAVLMDAIREGVDGPVVFVHTGGIATIIDEEGEG